MNFVQRYIAPLTLAVGILGSCAIAVIGKGSVAFGALAAAIVISSMPLAAYLEERRLGPNSIRWSSVWTVSVGYLAACAMVLYWDPADLVFVLPIFGGAAAAILPNQSNRCYVNRRGGTELPQE